jgi:hypothetical protein
MPQDEKKRLGKVHKKSLVEGYKVDQLRVCASFEVDFSPDRRQQQHDRPYATEKWSLALDRRCQNIHLI